MQSRGYRKITPIEYQKALQYPYESIFLWHRIDGFDERQEPNPINTTDLNLLLHSTTGSDQTNDTITSIHLSQVPTEEWPAPLGISSSSSPPRSSKNYSIKAVIHDFPFRCCTLILELFLLFCHYHHFFITKSPKS